VSPVSARIACVVAALLFGASTPASKALLSDLNVFALAGLLYLGGAIGTSPSLFSASWRDASRRDLGRLVLAMLSGGVAGPLLLMLGLRAAESASTSIWLNAELPATMVLGALLFGERLSGRSVLAGLLIALGSVALVIGEDVANARAGLLVLGACAAWGLDNNLTATISTITPAQTTFGRGLVAGTLNLAIGRAIGEEFAGSAVVGALAVGAFGYGLSVTLYIAGARVLGASRGQMLFATAPAWGVLLAWTALGERVHLIQVVAATLMAAGIALLLRDGSDDGRGAAASAGSAEAA
jgi:drug/metabolite transporter (DMT)-like permease